MLVGFSVLSLFTCSYAPKDAKILKVGEEVKILSGPHAGCAGKITMQDFSSRPLEKAAVKGYEVELRCHNKEGDITTFVSPEDVETR